MAFKTMDDGQVLVYAVSAYMRVLKYSSTTPCVIHYLADMLSEYADIMVYSEFCER
jgi:hypothetical protein